MIRTEAGAFFQLIPKALPHHRGNNQQQQRERHLSYHDQVAPPKTSSTLAIGIDCLEGGNQIDARGLERGDQAEYKRTEDGSGQRKDQNPLVDHRF